MCLISRAQKLIAELPEHLAEMLRRYAYLAPEQFMQHARVVDYLLGSRGTNTAHGQDKETADPSLCSG